MLSIDKVYKCGEISAVGSAQIERRALCTSVSGARIVVDELNSRAVRGWTGHESKMAQSRYGDELASITAAAADGLLARSILRALSSFGPHDVASVGGSFDDSRSFVRACPWRDPLPSDSDELSCSLAVVDGLATSEQLDVVMESHEVLAAALHTRADATVCRRALCAVRTSQNGFTNTSLVALGRTVCTLRNCVTLGSNHGVSVDWTRVSTLVSEMSATAIPPVSLPEIEAWRQMIRVASVLRDVGVAMGSGRVVIGPYVCSGPRADSVRHLDAALSAAAVSMSVPVVVTTALRACGYVCRCRFALLAPGGADWRAISATVRQAEGLLAAAGPRPAASTSVTGLASALRDTALDEMAAVAVACASQEVLELLRPLFESGCVELGPGGDTALYQVDVSHVSTRAIAVGLDRVVSLVRSVTAWCTRVGGAAGEGPTSMAGAGVPPAHRDVDCLAPAARLLVLGLAALRDVRAAIIGGNWASALAGCRVLSTLIGGDARADGLLRLASGLENPDNDAVALALGCVRQLHTDNVSDGFSLSSLAVSTLKSAVLNELRVCCVVCMQGALARHLDRAIDDGPLELADTGSVRLRGRRDAAVATRAVELVEILCSRAAIPLTRDIVSFSLSLHVRSVTCSAVSEALLQHASAWPLGCVDDAVAAAKERLVRMLPLIPAERLATWPLDERVSRQLELCRLCVRQRDARRALTSSLVVHGSHPDGPSNAPVRKPVRR